MNKTNKIIIVGGGSAGWMTAATLIKFYPEKNITVIESSNIPIVGVGESTLASIKFWTHMMEIDEMDFMEYTNASYKMSIKFTDFERKDAGSFHYPFGTPIEQDVKSWQIKKYFYPETSVNDYTDTYFASMAMIKNNKICKNEDRKFDNFNFKTDVAYHFDAVKFGEWLRERYCLPRGVNHIKADVTSIELSDDGDISKLILNSIEETSADLYIDCTGFQSLLLGKTLKEPFISYNDIIPNNRAWATQMPYVDKEKELEPFTNCTAIDNGWVWNIPLWSRIGTGYVYSDKHISPEDALEQFKTYLISDKLACPNKERVDNLQFREVIMKVGIHERTWVNNVVAIGLSAGFIEPLESNGLFSVHEFLWKLVKSLDRGFISQWTRDSYNHSTKQMFDSFAEFVALHYSLSNRDDTQYWKDISNRKHDTTRLGFSDIISKKMSDGGYNSSGGIHCIGTGMNYFPTDKVTIEVVQYQNNLDFTNQLNQFIEYTDNNKARWNAQAETCPTLYQYLKEMYNK